MAVSSKSSHRREWLGRRDAERGWLAFSLAALGVIAVALLVAQAFATSRTLIALEDQGRADAGLKVALLRAVLERPRSLPLILSRDRDVLEALEAPTSANLAALNRKLEDLTSGTNASVLYLINREGVAIASSNWREPTSFVGSDYAFRAYFTQALDNGQAEHFALGNVSGKPGLYISHSVKSAERRSLGVIVVKAEFDQLELDWRNALRPTFVTDDHGVVLITSIPAWRFHSLSTASRADLERVRTSRQFGEETLSALPVLPREPLGDAAGLVEATLPGEKPDGFVEVQLPVATTPWQLHFLLPVQPALSSAIRQAQLTALALLAPFLALAGFWLRRRQKALARLASEQAARVELESRVRERTWDLSQAKDRLQAEMEQRQAAEERLQGVQQELVQANRLAILGQVAAGVAHEINQPVATIRAYADNARTFLARERPDRAIDNLAEIGGLTERIGAITQDLKALARKGRGSPEPVGVREALTSAVMLLKSRFAGRLEALKLDLPEDGLQVLGNRLRLEQVLINLLQNALEAIASRPQGVVDVRVREASDRVLIIVADNGPGIEPEILGQLFTPFTTSKEAGLGLGLVIAKDIVSDYGGRIEVTTGSAGTCFTVDLMRAGS
ncbi:ATP-binding protein [Rhizobium sp. SSA_523]|nr:ATP-binding protein [Rhizobium sp. SSA_523]MCO5734824.1 ATP-binding protein [Rhizobium sp. SSA_523]WKC23446.1 ATP-binding protein [Rhizobium sp. SSA_523]